MRSGKTVALVLVVNAVAMLLLSDLSAGVEWKNLTVEDGLIDNCAMSLFESADGSIWIGTFGVGLNQYVQGEVLTWDQGASWLPDQIEGICEDSRGAIWCLSYNEGCGFLEGGRWHEGFTLDWQGAPGLQWALGGIACGPDGRLWAGFAEGIKWYDPETGESEKVWTSPRWGITDFWGVPHFLFVSSDGRIWFCSRQLGGQKNLYEMDDTGEILRIFPGLWGTVAQAPDGTIWFGDQNDLGNLGIRRLEGDQFVYAGPPRDYHGLTVRGPISFSADGELVCNGYDLDCHTVISTFDGKSWQPYVCPFRGMISVRELIIDRHGDIWIAHGNPGFGAGWGSGVWVLHRGELAPEISLDIATNQANYSSGDWMRLSMELLSQGRVQDIDVYVAVETSSGKLLFYPVFGAGMGAFMSSVRIPADTHLEGYELFSLTLPDLPEGTYRWFAACTHTGTMDLASNIASCEWEFEK